MLFNSISFLFLFLPILLILFGISERFKVRWPGIALMLVASIIFYMAWDPRYLVLLLASIVFNFLTGRTLFLSTSDSRRKLILTAGIAGNLATLFWFKYANFAFSNLEKVTGLHNIAGNIILPLGISFFTFTQIAFLCDVHARRASEISLPKYALFVTYFPHLIAGPIIHHAEMMPQFTRMKLNWSTLSIGFTYFFIGLAKKNLIADSVAPIANAPFHAAATLVPISFLESWMGALAYAVQLYFDFSAYSDMAIGLSFMFGVRLPINFNSPYKAHSLIEFWQRWHMTLSRFLRDYLYIPLGGNRLGEPRRYINLLLTMVLGGIWHGAGWTFLVWGAMHGCALAINHAWHSFIRLPAHIPPKVIWIFRQVGWLATFLFVVIAWVPFRSANISAALKMWENMVHGTLLLPSSWSGHLGRMADALRDHGVQFTPDNLLFTPSTDIPLVAMALLAAFFCPNTQQIMRLYEPTLETISGGAIAWKPTWRHAVLVSLVATAALLCLFEPSVFIYFQF